MTFILGVLVVLAMWVGRAIARDGVVRTARSILVAGVVLVAAWHALGVWLLTPHH